MPEPLKIRQVAEICLIRKEQVNEAVRILGIPQSRVSEIKNSSVCYQEAVNILYKKDKPLQQRITLDEIQFAVSAFVAGAFTLPEIDEELMLKPGTCLILTKTPIWTLEKYRFERWEL